MAVAIIMMYNATQLNDFLIFYLKKKKRKKREGNWKNLHSKFILHPNMIPNKKSQIIRKVFDRKQTKTENITTFTASKTPCWSPRWFELAFSLFTLCIFLSINSYFKFYKQYFHWCLLFFFQYASPTNMRNLADFIDGQHWSWTCRRQGCVAPLTFLFSAFTTGSCTAQSLRDSLWSLQTAVLFLLRCSENNDVFDCDWMCLRQI